VTEVFQIPEDYGSGRGLSPRTEATELIPVGTAPDGREVLLAPLPAAAWARMRDAAAAQGIILLPLSGFRSIGRQRQIIEAKLAAGQVLGDILCVLAAPGYSEHHTGAAVDIGTPGETPLTEHFARSAAFAWLASRAADFGFGLSYPRGNPHGIAYEPWHWFHSGSLDPEDSSELLSQ
jgi:D-alanyl-D-alanine carboxypeptidase